METFARLGVGYQVMDDADARAEAAEEGVYVDTPAPRNMAEWAVCLGSPGGLLESRDGYSVLRVDVGGTCEADWLFDPEGSYLGVSTEGPFVPAGKGTAATA